ncbi:hypothetical protein [Magnetospirillum sp. SS-4]|uniref:hypothetical protein n=1 Tax=Magnetospirillum sp. SS-4 TaxID=2681465 RepID=UPI00137D4AC3|nr:hypothetical protein [Magnetospirillum sp. SS-4]CAA7620031.1 hypothetical protein MTBSS4_270002 [Magnetospirillum sp. SS-4]
MDKRTHAFFHDVVAISRDFLSRVPPAGNEPSIDHTLKRLEAATGAARAEMVQRFEALGTAPPAAEFRGRHAVGMNTVGILCDRVTILLMKEWALRRKEGRHAEADHLLETQVASIVDALADASPGDPTLLNKVSTLTAEVNGDSWGAAYFGLLASNLLMWETQEILYRGDIMALPGDELRLYIYWFSRANMLRNECISRCERLFWS